MPTGMVADVAAMAGGYPPPVAAGVLGQEGLTGLKGTYSNVQDYLAKQGQFTPKPTVPTPGTELATSERVAAAMTPDELGRYFQTGEVPPRAAAAAVEKPSMLTRALKGAAPILSTAARVAGPPLMAYDVYQAGKFAQESELGRRLAEEGAARQAPQAFQNISVSGGGQYDIQPQEAANLLASNDERTINIYGGRQRLQAIAAGQSVGKPSATMPPIPQSAPYQAPPAPTNWMEKALQMASQYGPAQATVRKRPYTIGQ